MIDPIDADILWAHWKDLNQLEHIGIGSDKMHAELAAYGDPVAPSVSESE